MSTLNLNDTFTNIESFAKPVENLNTSKGTFQTEKLNINGTYFDPVLFTGRGTVKRAVGYTTSDLNDTLNPGTYNFVKEDPYTTATTPSTGTPLTIPFGSQIISCRLCNITRNADGDQIQSLTVGGIGTDYQVGMGPAGATPINAQSIIITTSDVADSFAGGRTQSPGVAFLAPIGGSLNVTPNAGIFALANTNFVKLTTTTNTIVSPSGRIRFSVIIEYVEPEPGFLTLDN